MQLEELKNDELLIGKENNKIKLQQQLIEKQDIQPNLWKELIKLQLTEVGQFKYV